MQTTRDRIASRCAELARKLVNPKPEDIERVRRELERIGGVAA